MAPVELLPGTTNFRIFYDSSLSNGMANAIQLAQTVEADFQTLTDWFGVKNGFGSGNRTIINLIFKDGSGSSNNGYHSDGSTTLNLNGAPNVTPVADVVRMHFVAEFSEVLMTYNNQHGPTTWVASASHGEGLSQYCAFLLAPNGYTAFYGPAFENTWLKANPLLYAKDWVNNTEATDANPLSFGCALLFLFYLHSQLAYDTKSIIGNGGSTLAETYTKLTGRGNSFDPFHSLLERFFPPSERSAILSIVNPFPLIEGPNRSVAVDGDAQNNGEARLVEKGHLTVKPFFTCPEKDYRYDILGQPYKLLVTAATRGFGAANFTWYVNGLVLTGSDGNKTIPIRLAEINPHVPGGRTTRDTAINFTWSVTDDNALTSILTLWLGGPFGKYELSVDVQAVEIYNHVPSATASDVQFLSNSKLKWEVQFYIDKAQCEKPFIDTVKRYVRAHSLVSSVLTLPDPPPVLTTAIDALNNLVNDLDSSHNMPSEVREGIETALRTSLNLSGPIGSLFKREE